MAHDVFISHSSIDKAAADTVCALLEADGIRCWIAPRDVQAGVSYAGSIIDAINASKAMVLIFPTFYAMTGGLILQRLLGYNLNVAVWGGLYRAILALRLRRASSWSSTFMKLSTISWLRGINSPRRRSRQQQWRERCNASAQS